jgi:hypothetical protein
VRWFKIKQGKDRPPIKADEFYELTGFNSTDILKFRKLDSEKMSLIRDEIGRKKTTTSIEDIPNNMLISNCEKFSTVDLVLEFIQDVLKKDYSENLKKSKKEGWDFYYFIGETNYVDGALLLVTNLFYPPNETKGNVLYNLVSIKTDGKSYFVWDMTS